MLKREKSELHGFPSLTILQNTVSKKEERKLNVCLRRRWAEGRRETGYWWEMRTGEGVVYCLTENQ